MVCTLVDESRSFNDVTMDCNANFVYISAESDTPPDVIFPEEVSTPPSNVVVLVMVVVVVQWGEIDTGKTRVAGLLLLAGRILLGPEEDDDGTADGAWMGYCCCCCF